MDLVGRYALVAIALAAIAVVVYVSLGVIGQNKPITEAQAISLVKSDLFNTYPNAEINVTNATFSQYPGSWHIVISLIVNATSPCPGYYVYTFDYPKYGFVYRVQNTYTQDCVVYGFSTGNYLITSYPVAIARSYNLNLPLISNYTTRFGYSNVIADATFYRNITILGATYDSVWVVSYSSPAANYSVDAVLTQRGGTPVLSYAVSK